MEIHNSAISLIEVESGSCGRKEINRSKYRPVLLYDSIKNQKLNHIQLKLYFAIFRPLSPALSG